MTFTDLFAWNDNFLPKAIQGMGTLWAFADWVDSSEILSRSIYRGTVKAKQLAYLKVDYKDKNENGGRSCKMITPSSYKDRAAGVCIPWGTMVQPAEHWVPEEPREYALPRMVSMENIS